MVTDGYQLSEIVRRKYPSVKIQLVSGFSDDRHLKFKDKRLHEDLLRKPFDINLLLKRLHDLLDNK